MLALRFLGALLVGLATMGYAMPAEPPIGFAALDHASSGLHDRGTDIESCNEVEACGF